MRKNKVKSTALLAIMGGVLATSSMVMAKDKSGGKNTDQETIVWMDGDEVAEILAHGAFWCMQPERDTCTFSAKVTQSEGWNFSYRVISLWTQDIIIEEVLDAQVAPNGILCEPNTLNLKRVSFTDLRGNPVDRATLEEARDELRTYFEEDSDLPDCFAYTRTGSNEPNIILQYYINESGEFIDPIAFSIDFSANAENNYLLRWEEYPA